MQHTHLFELGEREITAIRRRIEFGMTDLDMLKLALELIECSGVRVPIEIVNTVGLKDFIMSRNKKS